MKITFLGAGSTVFVRNVIGDCLVTDVLRDATYSLYDIDPQRLDDSHQMLSNINHNANDGRATFKTYIGLDQLDQALEGADFVINAVAVGGYEPSTVIDFEIPKKYGLRQTIADTLGIGGIFRALRTLPVFDQFADAMERVCPDAWFLNYTNPMSILTGYMQRYRKIKTVGLCHSVQVCVPHLLKSLEMEYTPDIEETIAGINHMAWLLSVKKDGQDLYPEIRRQTEKLGVPDDDRVRFEMMDTFGYYVTESSEHNAEYLPYFIKSSHPELIEQYNIPLDEYLRRCVRQIEDWNGMRESLTQDADLSHERTHEYGSYIIEAMVTNEPIKIGGNVLNTGLITNLPRNACVEVPCLIDKSGVQPLYVGDLPEACAALNSSNINVHLLTIEAYRSKKRADVYRAALLDPHTSAELTIEEIKSLCDDLLEAHADYLDVYE